MKKLLLIILFIWVAISSVCMPESQMSDNSSTRILREILPDSVYLSFKNKPMIFFSYGHYGYSWSIISVGFDDFTTCSGKVGYHGESTLVEQSEAIQIDSVLFFSENSKLILWGVDSLSVKAAEMTPLKRDTFMTIYSFLSIIDSDGKETFNSDDAIGFSGPDSLEFNHNFHRLWLIMYWLAEPNIRRCIPALDNA